MYFFKYTINYYNIIAIIRDDYDYSDHFKAIP